MPIRSVYFKVKGESFASARATFVGLQAENPIRKRLPGSENRSGKHYYGFIGLEKLTEHLELTSLRYHSTGNALRNDVSGACIIVDPDDDQNTA